MYMYKKEQERLKNLGLEAHVLILLVCFAMHT